MVSPRKRRLSLHKQALSPSRPETLPTCSASFLTQRSPAHMDAELTASYAPLHPEKISQLLSFAVSHIFVFWMLELSLSGSPNSSLHPNAFSAPSFPPFYTTLPACTSSAPLLQLVFPQDPDHDSRLTSIQRRVSDHLDGLIQHRVALKNSQKSLKEETIADRARVSALDGHQKQVLDLKDETLSLKELN